MSVFIFKTLFSLCEILFYIQSITLNSKGWSSWLLQSRKLERFGSEPEIFIVRQEISLSTFLSLSILSGTELRVAACRGLQEMDVLSFSLRADSESRRSDLIP